MKANDNVRTADGRRQRSERSQEAIIVACLSLMNEGNLVPTAQQISDRAGVGIRSFFRHFTDMDTLFTAVDERIRSSYEELFVFSGDGDSALDERIVNMVDTFSFAWEQLTLLMMSTKAQLWRSTAMRKNYGRSQRALFKEVERWLPEAASLPKDERNALDAVTSFEFWERLRKHQGLSAKATRSVLVAMITRFF